MNVSEKPILPHLRSAQYMRGPEKQILISASLELYSAKLPVANTSPPADK